MAIDITVLVSAGRHPVSGRARRAPNDARALELALASAGAMHSGVQVLHAGEPSRPALRDYLGMGIPALHVLPVDADSDILPPLLAALRQRRPQIVLTGVRSECGWSGGCLPYLLAQALGLTLVPNIDAILNLDAQGGVAELRQVEPRGRRRLLRAALPFLATVDPAAPAPRQSAFARARRGRIIEEVCDVAAVSAAAPGTARPARQRPRRRQPLTAAGSAADRLQAVTGVSTGGGRVLEAATAAEAAQAIYDYLAGHGLLAGQGHAPDIVPGD